MPVAALALSGCYPTVRQYVSSDTRAVIEVRAHEPASVRLDDDSTVGFARVRIVADTLYGWEDHPYRATTDSVAIALRRVTMIEQAKTDIARAVVKTVVVTATTVALCLGILVLIAIHQGD